MTALLCRSVQAPGLRLSVPLKTCTSPHRRGSLASQLCVGRGAKSRTRGRREVKTADEYKEKRVESLFWAGSQQPDSDQSASRLVPLVQWSRTTGRLPCNWDSSFHTENGTGAPWHSRAQIPSCGFLFKTISILNTSNYTQTKSS